LFQGETSKTERKGLNENKSEVIICSRNSNFLYTKEEAKEEEEEIPAPPHDVPYTSPQ